MKRPESSNIGKEEKQSWLEYVVNNLGKALLTTDTKGNITFLNEPAKELFNCKEESVIGRAPKEVIKLLSTATLKPISLPVTKALKYNQIYQSEQSLLLVDSKSKQRYATYTISPIKPTEELAGGTVIVLCLYEKEPEIHAPKVSLSSYDSDPEQNSIRNAAFYTKREGQFVRVMVDEVLWVEAMENYVQLITAEDRFLVHTTMKKLTERLLNQGFVRVHRSYIVPVNRVDAIEENRLKIGDKEIPIGKSFRQDLLQALTFI